ncbi:MAG: Gfo/Idh/MocA family oxidoreductase [Bryobacterales bacterium]|nr:Gfo/Idh/MocA family oxidoreductase [Bryobacteraceae bacterium]MDW8130990.1 Gfo/Idh/MocA family oxidoreductase [Bryobacterales bacterium]
MSERRVAWGVAGAGGIARRRTIPEGIVPAGNARLAAVYDVDPEVNRQVAERYGARAAASLEDLLGPDVEAVYVASPVYAHREQVVACARAGKHVLCEKPLGLTVAEAEEAVRACRKAGVLLGTAFMMRFHAQHQAALALIREGRLGKPVYARAQLSCWYPPIEGAWRQDPELGGGGSLMDMGGHCLDLLEMFFGRVRRLGCCTARAVHGYAVEDGATVLLEFAAGALGTVDVFFSIPDEASDNVLELYGSRGAILARGTIGQGDRGFMVARLREEEAGYDARQAREAAAGMEIAPAPVNTYRAEIEAFGRAVLEGCEPPVTGEDGLRNQRLLAACYESARTGRIVEVES